jgi:hypothetical protein
MFEVTTKILLPHRIDVQCLFYPVIPILGLKHSRPKIKIQVQVFDPLGIGTNTGIAKMSVVDGYGFVLKAESATRTAHLKQG